MLHFMFFSYVLYFCFLLSLSSHSLPPPFFPPQLASSPGVLSWGPAFPELWRRRITEKRGTSQECSWEGLSRQGLCRPRTCPCSLRSRPPSPRAEGAEFPECPTPAAVICRLSGLVHLKQPGGWPDVCSSLYRVLLQRSVKSEQTFCTQPGDAQTTEIATSLHTAAPLHLLLPRSTQTSRLRSSAVLRKPL